MKQISFQTKLVITYYVFIIFLMLILGFGFYYYNSYIFEKNLYSSLGELKNKISQQLDNCVQTMDYLSLDVISYEDLRNALRDLMYLDKSDLKNTEDINSSASVILRHTYRDSVIRSVYRLSVFNTKGDYYTSNYIVDSDTGNLQNKIMHLSWLKKAREKKGGMYLVPPSKDVWASSNPENVFSLVRVIKDPSNEIGFVEVQNSGKILEKICSVASNNNLMVLVINNEDNVIYSNKAINEKALLHYSSVLKTNFRDFATVKNPITKESEIISKVHSDYTGWTVLIMQTRASLLEPLVFLRNMTFIIGFLLMIITLACFYLFSRQLTRPLRKLKSAMEKVNIDNLPDQLVVQHENNEIESLSRSFQNMRQRLNEAINHEIKSRSMQMRAHFDALQAQINPHFVYNMLNVVANMGYEAGNVEISDTCRRISEMLRYSTSTESRRTTLKDEINHAENYLNLMKKRYEHKLEYQIKIDESLLDIQIPKLILQPLVENSLYHGFTNVSGRMEICIEGIAAGNEWYTNIYDNGSGFSEDVMRDLESQIENYAKGIYTNDEAQGLSIGGMGIISTFARLRLYYGEELKFLLKNNVAKGACITIGGSLNGIISGGQADV